jgi:hypothetical protein
MLRCLIRRSALLATLPLFPGVVEKLRQEQAQVTCSHLFVGSIFVAVCVQRCWLLLGVSALLATLPLFPGVMQKLRQEQQQVGPASTWFCQQCCVSVLLAMPCQQQCRCSLRSWTSCGRSSSSLLRSTP